MKPTEAHLATGYRRIINLLVTSSFKELSYNFTLKVTRWKMFSLQPSKKPQHKMQMYTQTQEDFTELPYYLIILYYDVTAVTGFCVRLLQEYTKCLVFIQLSRQPALGFVVVAILLWAVTELFSRRVELGMKPKSNCCSLIIGWSPMLGFSLKHLRKWLINRWW